MAEVKANGRKEQRERHRQRNDDGATNIAEKQEEDDDDEEDAFAQVVQDGVRGVVDQVAAVQVGNDLDALGKDLLVQLLNLLVNSIEGGIFVGAFEQEDDAADDVILVDDLTVDFVDGVTHLTETDFRPWDTTATSLTRTGVPFWLFSTTCSISRTDEIRPTSRTLTCC